jgi:tRNA(His) guanylyltransferase
LGLDSPNNGRLTDFVADCKGKEVNSKAFEAQMRQREAYHSLKVLPGLWIVLRVDGRSFHTVTSHLQKPYDESFHNDMYAVTMVLVEQFNALYGYTESDEISIVLPPMADMFDREVEKLVSVAAGTVSASFGECFDARIWLGTTFDDVLDYFAWRQSDAARCCLNAWCYWTLRKEGISARSTDTMLWAQNQTFKHDLLMKRGINFNDLPSWQRRGTGIYWQIYLKRGWNPQLNQEEDAIRRRLKVDDDLPMKEEYRQWLKNRLTT